MKKLSENKLLIIISSILSIIFLIILLNIKNIMIANTVTFSTFIIEIIVCLLIALTKKKNIIKYISIPTSCFLICLVAFNIFTVLNTTIGWSERIEFNKIEKEIKNNSELVYETDLTKIYYDNKKQNLYSINRLDNEFHILEGHVSESTKTEYIDLYGNGFKANTSAKNLKELYIHEPTTSTISSNEYILEMMANDGKTYIGKAFIVGEIKELEKYEKILRINYSDDYFDVYKDKENQNIIINNKYETTRTFFLNVEYRENDYFAYRYKEYLKAFALANSEEEITDENIKVENNNFKIQFTTEINDEKIKRIIVYDQTENNIYSVGSFLEIIYTDGTSDIAFANTLYGNLIQSVQIY